MKFTIECNCGKEIYVNMERDNKVICPKCGCVVFEKLDGDDIKNG